MRGLLNLLVISALFSTACSVKEDMDKMKENTEQVNKKTSQMAEATDQLKNRTEDLFHEGREVFSLQLVQESFKQLKEEAGISKKLQHALIYFSAMEFQHWQGDFEDSLEYRGELIDKSLRMFFADIEDMVADDFPVSTPYFFGHENWVNLSALSLGMSKIHLLQERKAKAYEVPAYSIYDLIKLGLQMEEAYKKGEEVPDFVKTVLENKQNAAYLLQLRHNFFSTIIISKISAIEESYFFEFEKITYTLFEWEADLTPINQAQYAKWVSWLKYANETREFLSSMGWPIQENSFNKKVFSKMKLVTLAPTDFHGLLKSLGANSKMTNFKDYRLSLKGYQPVYTNLAEEFVVRLNQMTGSTLLVMKK